jgi:hypothetical protein
MICAVALLAAPAFAQDKSADMNMRILRDKVKADKTTWRRSFSMRRSSIEESQAKLRKDYAAINKLTKMLPATKAARYRQIEGKIRAAIRHELAANIPLVE